jgi:hypothetical protein
MSCLLLACALWEFVGVFFMEYGECLSVCKIVYIPFASYEFYDDGFEDVARVACLFECGGRVDNVCEKFVNVSIVGGK